ncbi:hypothetical protein AB205_0163330, partial [Aquarana catesbeiana]
MVHPASSSADSDLETSAGSDSNSSEDEVLPDGSYVKYGSDKLNYFAMIGLRVSIVGYAVDSLKKACTISVRYSAVRRQSELKPGHCPFLSGITVGDIGPKMAFQQVDNGYLMMRNIRIPKENMLSRFSEVLEVLVLPDGSYVKRGSEKINYFTMIAVRVAMIGGEVVETLMKACTISVRYSAVRRQSEMKPGAQEAKILDYQTQQQKLFPLLATCYSIHFMARQMTAFYNEAFKEIRVENFNSLAELHAIASGLKGFATETCSNGVEVCRKACGGHGYSLFSGLPSLYTRVVASCTYEGENTVLHLQAA